VDERHSGYEPLIGAWNAINITITGDNGTIDGRGPAWWPIRAELTHGRPHLLFFSRSSHIRVSNLTLRSSPFWCGKRNAFFGAIFTYIQTTILPRLDRDKHKDSSKKEARFLQDCEILGLRSCADRE
jgi:hypothetical protein